MLADPGEKNNVVAANPEVLQRLKKSYDTWFDDVSSTRPDNYAPPRIFIGTPHENPTPLTRQDWRGGTWHKDSIGHWLVDVKKAGTYSVRVEFDPEPKPDSVTLTAGDDKWDMDVDAGRTFCEFKNVKLKVGEQTIGGHLSNGDKKRGVWQIIVGQ